MPTKKVKTFQELLDEKWVDFLKAEKAKKYPNIMLIGKSGAGKSSLINKVFGKTIAPTSDNAPRTKDFIFYNGHDFSRKINLIDSAGYELNQSEEYLGEIITAINKEYDGVRVNAIWYCISLDNERIQPIDLRLIKDLFNEDPIRGRLCIVFTQCDCDDVEGSKEKRFTEVLQSNGVETLEMFSVSINDNVPNQLNDLVNWSSNKIEEKDLHYAFVASQMQDLDLKKKEANRIIDLTCTETAITEFLANNDIGDRSEEMAEFQIQMVTRIFGVYGIDCLEGISKSFEKGTSFSSLCLWVTDHVSSLLSKKDTFITELLIKGCKYAIPIALTKAIGTLASRASYRYVKAHINGKPVHLEELYSDPNHAGFIKLLVSDFLDNIKEKGSPPESEAENKAVGKQETKKTKENKRGSNGQRSRRKK